MSQKENSKFIFISGLPRSGGLSLLRSFDSHPEVLVWPVEFFYFDFFQKIATSQKKTTVQNLNVALEKIFAEQLSKEIQKEKPFAKFYHALHFPSKKNIKAGDFDYKLFFRILYLSEDKEINAIDYLTYIFECLKKANSLYREKIVKYYLVYTTARGMNWYDEKLIRASCFLFSCREIEASYSSLLEKVFFKKGLDLKTSFSIKKKKSFLYWLESYRLISKQVEPHIKRDNFFIIPLKKLQKDPEGFLKKICTFLSIEPHPKLFNLSIFGIPYSGNANQSNLNSAKIATTTSKIRVPLCYFEQRMFNSIRLYDFVENKKRDLVPFRFFEMLQTAFTSAFFELPANKIGIKEKYSPILNILVRVFIFCNFCAIYFIMKSEPLSLAVIRKWNKHIENMPIWNESVMKQTHM